MFAELQGLPPMLIQVGGGETMLDDSALFAHKAMRARCQVSSQLPPSPLHHTHTTHTTHTTHILHPPPVISHADAVYPHVLLLRA